MYVATVPNRGSPPAILLREAFRLNGKVNNRTLANLSRWPPEKIEALRRVLKGETACSVDKHWPTRQDLCAEESLPGWFREARSTPPSRV